LEAVVWRLAVAAALKGRIFKAAVFLFQKGIFGGLIKVAHFRVKFGYGGIRKVLPCPFFIFVVTVHQKNPVL